MLQAFLGHTSAFCTFQNHLYQSKLPIITLKPDTAVFNVPWLSHILGLGFRVVS